MLVHEAVKGIYEVILSASIPENEELAKTVLANADTFEQEIVGQRVGPQLRQDLLNFVNEHPATDKYPDMNIFERVLGILIEEPPEEFLQDIRGILEDDPDIKTKINSIIDMIAEYIEEYKQQLAEYESEYGISDVVEPESTEPDYASMSKTELNNLINQAIETGDFNLAKKISEYI
jgi:hypothetical protein